MKHLIKDKVHEVDNDGTQCATIVQRSNPGAKAHNFILY